MADTQIVTEVERIVKQAQDLDLTEVHELTLDGETRKFRFRIDPTQNGRKLGEIVSPPRPAKLEVETLTGLIDAVIAGVAGVPEDVIKTRIFHVEDHHTVSVQSVACDHYGIRDKYVVAKYTPPGNFDFDQYMPSEKFIIALETSFLMLDGDDMMYVKKLVSNLKAGDTVHAQDDGVNQSVTIKTGEVQTAEVKVKARVKLTPIRTFAEVAPVESEFLIRLKPAPSGLPYVALFNLNGLKWQAETMQSIKKYLVDHLADGTLVLA